MINRPCFPSDSTVRLACGTLSRLDALKHGDSILAASADGKLYYDEVSFLSIAMPEQASTFVKMIAGNTTLIITDSHHVSVGPQCCDEVVRAEAQTTVNSR